MYPGMGIIILIFLVDLIFYKARDAAGYKEQKRYGVMAWKIFVMFSVATLCYAVAVDYDIISDWLNRFPND